MKKGMALILAALAILFAAAPAARAEEDYHQKVETFFASIKAGKVEEAVDIIYADNPWISKDADAVQNLKTQLKGLDQMVGKYNGHEKVIEKVVAGRFAYLCYFVAYDRQPLSFIFEFYRPKDRWMTFSFSFNTDIDEEIESQAKAELLDGRE